MEKTKIICVILQTHANQNFVLMVRVMMTQSFALYTN